jgi:L-ascorbate peroxidase
MQGVDQAQLQQAKKLILELLHERKPHPLMIRLAWHDSGTYDKVLQQWTMLSLRTRWHLADMTLYPA